MDFSHCLLNGSSKSKVKQFEFFSLLRQLVVKDQVKEQVFLPNNIG